MGEPINPEAWYWYYDTVGREQCSITDTWFQTETGGHMITPLPGCTPMKPGSASLPFFGAQPALVDDSGEEITSAEGEGHLVFKAPWPGMLRGVNGSQQRFEDTYFGKFPGYYCAGDMARRDRDGYYWIIGRSDDMLNVSGHLIATAEVEAALMEHAAVAEAAVVSKPHKVKGECLYAYLVLKIDHELDRQVWKELREQVRRKIGPFAAPENLHPLTSLPKTRSGKVMRRVLAKFARNEADSIGDISSIADVAVLDELKQTSAAYL